MGRFGGPLPLPDGRPLPGHPRSEELTEVWQSTRAGIAPLGPLQIGGYADEEAIDSGPVANAVPGAVRTAQANGWPASEDTSDWVLLAD